MTPPEIHLKCLELALVQARNEGNHGDVNRVAEIETRFYNLCTASEEVPPKPETAKGQAPSKRGRAVKPDALFE